MVRSTSNSVQLVGGDRKAFGVWRSAFSVLGARGDVGVLRLRSVVRNSVSFQLRHAQDSSETSEKASSDTVVGQAGVSWRVRGDRRFTLADVSPDSYLLTPGSWLLASVRRDKLDGREIRTVAGNITSQEHQPVGGSMRTDVKIWQWRVLLASSAAIQQETPCR